jgi:hypothetical protein
MFARPLHFDPREDLPMAGLGQKRRRSPLLRGRRAPHLFFHDPTRLLAHELLDIVRAQTGLARRAAPLPAAE